MDINKFAIFTSFIFIDIYTNIKGNSSNERHEFLYVSKVSPHTIIVITIFISLSLFRRLVLWAFSVFTPPSGQLLPTSLFWFIHHHVIITVSNCFCFCSLFFCKKRQNKNSEQSKDVVKTKMARQNQRQNNCELIKEYDQRFFCIYTQQSTRSV